MSPRHPLYHEIQSYLMTHLDRQVVPVASAERLVILIVGILAAQRTVAAQIAGALYQLMVTSAQPDSIGRRLRRLFNDPHLKPETCYHPVVRQVVDWPGRYDRRQEVTLIIDESSKEDEIHLFRVSLAFWGGSLPISWAVWAQNVAQESGEYWRLVKEALDQAAALIPPDRRVMVLADRGYGVPGFIDRVEALGWNWIVRVTTRGSHRVRDPHHGERALKTVVAQRLTRPGQRFRLTGELFKDAGWRPVNIVGVWGRGHKEPLVVLTNRRPSWSVVRLYERRFWIEAGFRNDKSRGWQWEESQVQGVEHHRRLLLGMAWATLITICLGAGEADERWKERTTTPVTLRRKQERPGLPRHARESLFTMGLGAIKGGLFQARKRPIRWWLPDIGAPSWAEQWYTVQSKRFLADQPVRP